MLAKVRYICCKAHYGARYDDSLLRCIIIISVLHGDESRQRRQLITVNTSEYVRSQGSSLNHERRFFKMQLLVRLMQTII